jgi:hypothetical protein
MITTEFFLHLLVSLLANPPRLYGGRTLNKSRQLSPAARSEKHNRCEIIAAGETLRGEGR